MGYHAKRICRRYRIDFFFYLGVLALVDALLFAYMTGVIVSADLRNVAVVAPACALLTGALFFSGVRIARRYRH